MSPDLDKLKEKKQFLEHIRTKFDALQFTSDTNSNNILCHYTSLPALFSILESDSLWATATRFSNDSSEEQIFSDTAYYKTIQSNIQMDNFLICVSQNTDCLSQWRGYCANGGGAIELDLMQPCQYSVLYANYETSSQFKLVTNAPLRMLYVPQNHALHEEIMQMLQKASNPKGLPIMHELLPYFKNESFREEGEWRLLFENTTNQFSPCVRFRTLRNGVKVPYLVVKCGNISDNLSQCAFDIRSYDDNDTLLKQKELHQLIEIPQGNNQESIYYELKQIIHTHMTRSGQPKYKYPRIICAGHLPVRRIILAPTYDRERLREEIQRFCRSIYWLQDVEVVSSKIPYIPPSD